MLQVCNGDSYLHVRPAELHRAWAKKTSQPRFLQAAMEERARSQTTHGPPPGRPVTKVQEGDAYSLVSNLSNSNSYLARALKKLDASNDDDRFYHINMEVLCLENGVPLQVEDVPESVFMEVKVFYICASCGKVHWEGTHYERVCKQVSYLLKDKDEK